MNQPPAWFYRQSAVIPYRIEDGEVEVLLITSRTRKRWVVPKGVIEPHLTAAESACHEAWEEAGIAGRISAQSVGSYEYTKWGGTCTVEVFLLQVDEIYADWPEIDLRDRVWVSVADAARLVQEHKLKKMVENLPKYVGRET